MSENANIEWYNNIEVSELDNVKLDLAVAVERALNAAGKKRVDLAKSIGVSPSRITKILRGDANLTLDLMQKIAEALNHKIHVHLAPKGVEVRSFNIMTAQNAPMNQPLRSYRVANTQVINPVEFAEAA